MKGNFESKWMALAGLVALVLSIGTGAAWARPNQCKGSFTLNSETRWGQANLPAGRYTFDLDMTNDLITVTGSNRTVMIMSVEHHAANHLNRSSLILVSRGGEGAVRELRISAEKLVFRYIIPKRSEGELAEGRVKVQSVPVTEGGK